MQGRQARDNGLEEQHLQPEADTRRPEANEFAPSATGRILRLASEAREDSTQIPLLVPHQTGMTPNFVRFCV